MNGSGGRLDSGKLLKVSKDVQRVQWVQRIRFSSGVVEQAVRPPANQRCEARYRLKLPHDNFYSTILLSYILLPTHPLCLAREFSVITNLNHERRHLMNRNTCTTIWTAISSAVCFIKRDRNNRTLLSTNTPFQEHSK